MKPRIPRKKKKQLKKSNSKTRSMNFAFELMVNQLKLTQDIYCIQSTPSHHMKAGGIMIEGSPIKDIIGMSKQEKELSISEAVIKSATNATTITNKYYPKKKQI